MNNRNFYNDQGVPFHMYVCMIMLNLCDAPARVNCGCMHEVNAVTCICSHSWVVPEFYKIHEVYINE